MLLPFFPCRAPSTVWGTARPIFHASLAHCLGSWVVIHASFPTSYPCHQPPTQKPWPRLDQDDSPCSHPKELLLHSGVPSPVTSTVPPTPSLRHTEGGCPLLHPFTSAASRSSTSFWARWSRTLGWHPQHQALQPLP